MFFRKRILLELDDIKTLISFLAGDIARLRYEISSKQPDVKEIQKEFKRARKS